jgi:hypothetical protein
MVRPSHAWLLVLLAGCMPGAGEVTGPPDRPQVQQSNDGLSMNGLSQNRLSLNRLSLNALSGDRLTLDGSGLEATPEGRELLTYVVRCALPENEELSVEISGTTYVFPGLLGMAPQWVDGECDLSCQRWVSGCLLAHVNAFGVSVPISVRTPGTEIATSQFEIAEYDVQEGAFWGNLFVEDGQEVEMNSCSGHAMVEGDLEHDPNSWLSKRQCAAWDTTHCGFDLTGTCSASEWSGGACQNELGAAGILTRCSDDWEGAPVYEEVVTIYLPN